VPTLQTNRENLSPRACTIPNLDSLEELMQDERKDIYGGEAAISHCNEAFASNRRVYDARSVRESS